MKVAIIGSRSLNINNMKKYLNKDIDEIITGGAKGIDSCAKLYAEQNNIKITEILPEYSIYGKAAPIIRNKVIVALADKVIAFWDGKSKGTKFVIEHCKKTNKEIMVFIL